MTDPSAREGGRQATEKILQDAALQQLNREGILAGLNLRQVADEAGVNRGLVYHYFGSRRGLLRSALGRDVRNRLSAVRAASALPLRDRMTRFFTTMLSQRESIEVATLLVLDGDDEVRVMPLREETRDHLERDVDQGHLDPDLDFDAVHAASVSLVWGYSLYRDAFAREFGVPAKHLDTAVRLVFDRMLAGLAPAHIPAPASSGEKNGAATPDR